MIILRHTCISRIILLKQQRHFFFLDISRKNIICYMLCLTHALKWLFWTFFCLFVSHMSTRYMEKSCCGETNYYLISKFRNKAWKTIIDNNNLSLIYINFIRRPLFFMPSPWKIMSIIYRQFSNRKFLCLYQSSGMYNWKWVRKYRCQVFKLTLLSLNIKVSKSIKMMTPLLHISHSYIYVDKM